MAEAQVTFRLERELLAALDALLPSFGFKTRNEWFREQVRIVVDTESDRRQLGQLLETLTREGITESEVLGMVKALRAHPPARDGPVLGRRYWDPPPRKAGKSRR